MSPSGGPPNRRSSSDRRRTPERRDSAERRVVTMAPSPWRRRKRVRPWVLLKSTTDVVMLLLFAGLVAFACWSAQSRTAPKHPGVSHARVRPGSSALPLPETPETKP